MSCFFHVFPLNFGDLGDFGCQVKRRWHSEHSDPFHCARLGDAAAQLALAQQGVALGVLLAIDWLEPGDAGDGGMAKELTERIMRRQMASFCWENSEKSNGTNGGHGNNGSMSSMSLGYGNKADVKSPFRDRSIMILPRYAGHIHVLAPRDVKISDMSSLDFKTLKKMVKWFREEAGLADDAAIHIIASIHTPVSQIFHGIQHIHHMNERLGIEGIPQSFAGFWIDEENAMNAMSIDARPKLPQSFQTSSPFEVMEEIRRLFSTSGDLGASGASTLSFLVALSALEHLGDLDDQTISRISAAIKGSVGTDGMHGTHGTDGVPPVATSQTGFPSFPSFQAGQMGQDFEWRREFPPQEIQRFRDLGRNGDGDHGTRQVTRLRRRRRSRSAIWRRRSFFPGAGRCEARWSPSSSAQRSFKHLVQEGKYHEITSDCRYVMICYDMLQHICNIICNIILQHNLQLSMSA